MNGRPKPLGWRTWCAAIIAVLGISWVATATVGVHNVRTKNSMLWEVEQTDKYGMVRLIPAEAPAWSPCPFVVVAEWREGGYLFYHAGGPDFDGARWFKGVYVWFFGFQRRVWYERTGYS